MNKLQELRDMGRWQINVILNGQYDNKTYSCRYKVRNRTLWMKPRWGNFDDVWYPIVSITEDYTVIGFNYTAKDMASFILQRDWFTKMKAPFLKWVEIGRGIGNKSTRSQERDTPLGALDLMFNPTSDMLVADADMQSEKADIFCPLQLVERCYIT